MKSWLNICFMGVALCLLCGSCKSTLKAYERIYVNDQEMQMAAKSAKAFQNYVYSIREGSSRAEGGKGNGGCGCN